MRLIAILIALVFTISVAACGDSATSLGTESLHAAAGYWSVPSSELPYGGFLLQVVKRNAAYYVSIDGGPLRPATLDQGRIVLPLKMSGGRRLEFGLDGQRPALYAYVSHGMNPGPGEPTGYFWAPFPVKRLTRSVYETRAGAKADETMYYQLVGLDFALRAWAAARDGQLPAAADVRQDSAFGSWFDSDWTDIAQLWPTNPYTGAPMQAGTHPGEFTYTRDGTDYTLVGYGHDGSVISPKNGPPE